MTNAIALRNMYCRKESNNFAFSSDGFMPLLLHDADERKNLKFQLKVDDYFGTLATILDLARQITEQKISELEKINQAQSKLLNGLKEDLMHLQENYKIVKKRK